MIRLLVVLGLLLPLTARADEAPLKIAVMPDLTSTYADIGGMGSVEAVRMAVEDFGGKVLGKPIEVIYADDGQNKPDLAAAQAREWYDSGVDMITDLPASGVALAVIQVANEKHKLAFVASAGSSEITGRYCSPYELHWNWDTYSVAHATGGAVVRNGGKSWFFLTADYVFGKSLESDTAKVVEAAGGRVLGQALSPLGTSDFSSPLLQAQASGATVIGLANGGTDMQNAVKQAAEYHVIDRGVQLAALIAFISDVHSLGLKVAQKLLLTSSFYWDQDAATRAWSQRFFARVHRMPSMTQAGMYGEVMHYLKAIAAIGTKDPLKVMAQMRATPINDFMTHDGHLRIDGQVARDMYLFEVKTPAESHGEWDLYKQVSTIPAAEAFRPLDQGGCPLVH